MKVNGPLTSAEDIFKYFENSKDFGSLFILSEGSEEGRAVCEVKVVNSGLGEIGFVPIGEDLLIYDHGTEVKGINESNNVSFKAVVQKNHAGKWVTLSIPSEFRMVNLRRNQRHTVSEEKLGTKPELASYSEDGVKKVMSFQGILTDISEVGASFEIETQRLDGYYKGDVVELKASEKYSYLSRLRGQIVHKTLFEEKRDNLRRYRIGIRFHKPIDLKPIQ
ncbi:MAG: PilZ domain-containing protein [Halobacteriovoraceae bacterium]|nr:PilZ domain-containing protein [Halobacteriovoraceae bacterium]